MHLLTLLPRHALAAPAARRRLCCGSGAADRAPVARLGHIPDLPEDLDREALVVGVVAREVAVVLEPGKRAGAAEDEFLPVAHVKMLWWWWRSGRCAIASGSGLVGMMTVIASMMV